MRVIIAALAAAAAAIPVQGALACPPAPPGYVPPTDEEHLTAFVRDAPDIVYGIVQNSANAGERSRLKILHVYKGSGKKGDTIEVLPGHDYPVPFCAGMMAPPTGKPAGTWGVFAIRGGASELNMIHPRHVRMMIEQGLIRSARAR